MMRKLLLGFIILIFIYTCGIAVYTEHSFVKPGQIEELGDYEYYRDSGFSHLFDTESETLEDLMNQADAVVICEKKAEVGWKAGCLETVINVKRCVKGSLSGDAVCFEPLTLTSRAILGVYGYVPMQYGREYLLFLQECKAPLQGQYYPLCGDIGKFEKGKRAKLQENGFHTLKQIQDECVVVDAPEEMERYNHVYDEIEKTGLFE